MGSDAKDWARFMPHPLAIKYGTGSPSLWDDGKRAKAREELQEALGEGTGASKRLKSEDRIELMRIWLAVIAAAHESKKAPTSLAQPAAPKPKRFRIAIPSLPGAASLRALHRMMSWADYVFVAILSTITLAVILLGIVSVGEVMRVEDVKKDAEDLAAWFKTSAEERKKGDFQPAACRRSEDNTWKQCVAALIAENGPLNGKINAFQPGRTLISRKCDQQDTETIGTIVVERGAVASGASTMTYSPFDGTETLNKDFNLRILVCGRGFHLIKVQNDLAW